MKKIIIDVRTREEFVKEHIKDAVNIPHYDLDQYMELLRDREIILYCNTERRSAIAQDKLAKLGLDSKVLTLKEQEAHDWVEGQIVCAANFVTIREGHEASFMASAMDLCRTSEHLEGFMGSKVLKISGISSIGSFVPGDLSDAETKPTRMILLTYWTSKEAHERSHMVPDFKAVFDKLAEHLACLPREEFYEVLK